MSCTAMRQSPCTTTQDLDDLATVSTDRAGVPKGGQVHVTVSDFRLNLDPTEKDEWTMRTKRHSCIIQYDELAQNNAG